jgi:glycosyltransferase involved in cell wall biosynthesis
MSLDAPGTSPSTGVVHDASVLLIIDQLRHAVPGGIGTYVRGLLQGLDELVTAGELSRSTVQLYASRAPRPDPLSELGFSLSSSRLSSAVLSRAWRVGALPVGVSGGLVHALSLQVPPSRAALVVTVHDLAWREVPEAYSAHGRRWHEHQLGVVREQAAGVVVPDVTVADQLIAAGLARTRIEVIEHGSDHLAPADERACEELLAALEVTGSFFLSVGTLEPRKNLTRLMAGYERARSRLKEAPALLIVGPRGWGGGLGMPVQGVKLAGAVSPGVLAALYRRARLLAYVPLREGYGLPVAEAMRAGLPVLASPVPAAAKGALVVDPLDVAAISDGLVALETTPALRSQLIGEASELSSARTWRRSASAHLELWREVWGETNGSRP